VNRFPADQADHVAVSPGEADPLSGKNLRIPPSDWPDEREALVVDPDDNDADLVDVPREHDRDWRTLVHYRDTVSGDVTRDGRELLRLFTPQPRRGRFEAARAGNVEEFLQEQHGLGTEHVLEVGGQEPEVRATASSG
jgi:hypothetical protein